MTLMATKLKKSDFPVDIYMAKAIRYSPIWVPSLIIAVFLGFGLWPAINRLSSLSQEFAENKNSITTAALGTSKVATMREELGNFRKTVTEFEDRLPKRMKTTLIIETLQEITKKTKLKFSSLEPLPIKKYTLDETKDVFVELPVKVKLNCGYYDLVNFLKRIETADQLMKISNLNIKNNPLSEWEHTIEFSISAFSKGESDEE